MGMWLVRNLPIHSRKKGLWLLCLKMGWGGVFDGGFLVLTSVKQ